MGGAAVNAQIIESIFAGDRGAPRDAVVLNAAAALVVAEAANDLREGAEQAAAAIDSGATRKVLEELRSFS